MKAYICCLAILVFAALPARGTLYMYPNDKRPAVSLAEACIIAKHLLKTRGDEKRFYITGASLLGSKEQDGWGAWNLMHYDKDGNHVNVYIQFPSGHVGLHYYPHDYDKNGGDQDVKFDKTAKQILAEQDADDRSAAAVKQKF
jgi:hypothetical protein